MREELENLINDSPLFSIDKDSSPELYKTERYKFLTLLTDYYRFYIYPNKPLDSYSMTLMETAVECIKYYDKDKGEFLHLFNKAMKRELEIAKAKELIDERRQGIRISGDDDKLIRKIMAFVNSKGLDASCIDVQEKIAKVLGVNVEKVQELIRINDDAVAVSSTVKNDDGEEVDLFDLQISHEKSAEEKLVEESSILELIDRINTVFISVQDRQKKLLSMVLTAEIIKAFDCDTEKAKEILYGKELFNKEIFDYCLHNGEIPTAKQIGVLCGVSEQSLSRTYKNFKEKLK